MMLTTCRDSLSGLNSCNYGSTEKLLGIILLESKVDLLTTETVT